MGYQGEKMEKTIILLIALCVLSMGAAAKSGGHSGGSHSNGSNHSVRGHVTKKGVYVKPHHATNPNKTKRDNYSQKGNVNPYTGKEGTKQ